MKTMTDEIYKRFERIVKDYQSVCKRKSWTDRFKEIKNLLHEEFADIDIEIELNSTTRYAGAWVTESYNDEARVYTYGDSHGKWFVFNYLAMTVKPARREIFDNKGNKIAEYEYKKDTKEWLVRLVVSYRNEKYYFNWEKDCYEEKAEKMAIKTAIEIIKTRRKKNKKN